MTEHDTQNKSTTDKSATDPTNVSSVTGTHKVINLTEARMGIGARKSSENVSTFGQTNLVRPNLAAYYTNLLPEMTAAVVRRHYADLENQMIQYENGKLPLTEADRLEIGQAMAVLGERLDDIVPQMAADIRDHDHMMGSRTALIWPQHLEVSTMLIHFHFVELLHAWNLNPFKRDMGVAAVDEFAEEQGVSRFSFTSKESLDDFVDYYELSDFVVSKFFAERSDAFSFLTLSNKFTRDQANEFLDVYKSAMNTLAVINEERTRAIRHDGGKVGFVSADHFNAREKNELNRITFARQKLGAGANGAG